jgi:hypothetical protein
LEDLGLHFFALRWTPHRLSDQQKVERIDLSQHLLAMMQGLASKQQTHHMTRYQSWIDWDGQRRGMRVQDRDKPLPNVKQTISSKNNGLGSSLASAFVSVEFLPMGQKHNSQPFTGTVLLSIERKLANCRPKL